jgi:hypothetical protein
LGFTLKTLATPFSPLVEVFQFGLTDRPSTPGERHLDLSALLRVRFYRAMVMALLLLQGGKKGLAGRWNLKV